MIINHLVKLLSYQLHQLCDLGRQCRILFPGHGFLLFLGVRLDGILGAGNSARCRRPLTFSMSQSQFGLGFFDVFCHFSLWYDLIIIESYLDWEPMFCTDVSWRRMSRKKNVSQQLHHVLTSFTRFQLWRKCSFFSTLPQVWEQTKSIFTTLVSLSQLSIEERKWCEGKMGWNDNEMTCLGTNIM